MSTITTLNVFSGVTDKAPLSPTYINAKFAEFTANDTTLFNGVSAVNTVANGMYVNVKDAPYGAKGDGVTDDSAAFAAALIAAGSGTVFVPAGTYKITSTLVCSGTIMGVGAATILSIAAVVTGIQLNADQATVQRLRMRAEIATTKPAIEIIGYRAFWHIDDVLIFNTANGAPFDVGVKVTSGLSGVMSNVRVDAPASYGIYLTDNALGSSNAPNAIRIYGPGIRSSGVADIFVENAAQGPTIHHPVCEGNRPLGIYIKGSPNTVIINPYFEATGAAIGVCTHLKIENSDDVGVISGSWTGPSLVDISLINSDSCVISGLYPNGTTSISIDATCDRTTIVGGQANAVTDNGTSTLRVDYGRVKGRRGGTGIGAATPTFEAVKDDTGPTASHINGQLRITGHTDTNRRLHAGYNTTDDWGWIQAVNLAVAGKPLALNPNSGGDIVMGHQPTSPSRNGITITSGAGLGGIPIIGSSGSDGGIDMTLTSKGTGRILVTSPILSTAQYYGPTGTTLLPPLAFSSETSLGWYRSGQSALGISYGQIQGVAGTAIQPSFAFSSESSLGFYKSATSTLALSYGTMSYPLGAKLSFQTGTNASFGTVQLGSNGSVNVATNVITPNSVVMLTVQVGAGTIGTVELGGPVRTGSGFTILSNNVLDTSTVAWWVLEPRP